jgi:hypothetical protein
MRSFVFAAALLAVAASASSASSLLDSALDDDAAVALSSSFDNVFDQSKETPVKKAKKAVKKLTTKQKTTRYSQCNDKELNRCKAWKGGKACLRKFCVKLVCKAAEMDACEAAGKTVPSCEAAHCEAQKVKKTTHHADCDQASLAKCEKNKGGKACKRKWCATVTCNADMLAKCKAKGTATPKCEATHCERKPATAGVSAAARKQMECVIKYGLSHNAGRSRGDCFKYVWNYLTLSGCGYGRIKQHGDVPNMKSSWARHFADYFNVAKHRKEWQLKKLPAKTPWDCPRGGVVVVKPDSPGTSHSYAGDITLALGNGKFLNDGPMNYRERSAFPPSKMMGCFVPDI